SSAASSRSFLPCRAASAATRCSPAASAAGRPSTRRLPARRRRGRRRRPRPPRPCEDPSPPADRIAITTRIRSPNLAVVTRVWLAGSCFNYPAGGHFWVFLNWTLGLAAAGAEIVYLEHVIRPGGPKTVANATRVRTLFHS